MAPTGGGGLLPGLLGLVAARPSDGLLALDGYSALIEEPAGTAERTMPGKPSCAIGLPTVIVSSPALAPELDAGMQVQARLLLSISEPNSSQPNLQVQIEDHRNTVAPDD